MNPSVDQGIWRWNLFSFIGRKVGPVDDENLSTVESTAR
jgi:hypothetical protein